MEKDNEAGKPSLTNDHRSHLPDKAPVVTETESLVPGRNHQRHMK